MIVPTFVAIPARPRRRTTTPTAAIQLPAVRTLAPDRRGVDETGALALPVAFAPEVAVTIPIPETGDPDKTMARRRQGFGARRWWRRTDIDVHGYLRLGSRQYHRRCTQRQQAGEYYFFHHI